MTERYQHVNGAWPEGTSNGRDIKPTPQEALSGARRLFRIAMGRPFKGRMQLTSGRKRTWIRRGVFYVNPDEGARFRNGKRVPYCTVDGVPQYGGGGWHEIVHAVSHYASNRLYPNARGHSHQHAFLEKTLIGEVVKRGWLDGKLRRPEKPAAEAVDPRAAKLARIEARAAAWEAKRKRAENALRKIKRQQNYYHRTIQL